MLEQNVELFTDSQPCHTLGSLLIYKCALDSYLTVYPVVSVNPIHIWIPPNSKTINPTGTTQIPPVQVLHSNVSVQYQYI